MQCGIKHTKKIKNSFRLISAAHKSLSNISAENVCETTPFNADTGRHSFSLNFGCVHR